MSTDYKFQGWLGLDKESAKGKMVWQGYDPKPFDEENDVDIKITHCGICASDLHTLRSGWGPTDYPVCVGHEIVGQAVRVGSKVKHVQVGDRVGVGAQSGHCENRKGDCEACAEGLHHHCKYGVDTFGAKWPDGSKSWGGYADYWRGTAQFVVQIPKELRADEAAPMLCGGITAFHPLVQHNAGPKTRVGIIGLGGLGHFALMGAAQALKCKRVIAISRTNAKKEDAMKMGATDFIATDEDKDWAQKYEGTLDVIVSTVSSPSLPLQDYLQLLALKGTYVHVGAPEDVLPNFNVFSLILNRASIQGSKTGSAQDIVDMLKLFAETGVRTWNNNVPMKDANKAIVDMDAGKARYRYVLVHEDHAKETGFE